MTLSRQSFNSATTARASAPARAGPPRQNRKTSKAAAIRGAIDSLPYFAKHEQEPAALLEGLIHVLIYVQKALRRRKETNAPSQHSRR
jgi:hypothetical protein